MATKELPIVDGVLHFACPRCHQDVVERVYGPCETCRVDLRDRARREPTETYEVSRFEPKMHVQPNHVATKDD